MSDLLSIDAIAAITCDVPEDKREDLLEEIAAVIAKYEGPAAKYRCPYCGSTRIVGIASVDFVTDLNSPEVPEWQQWDPEEIIIRGAAMADCRDCKRVAQVATFETGE